VRTPNIWDNISKQIKLEKEKGQKRIDLRRQCIKNLKKNIKQEKERLTSGVPRTWQPENWLAINQNKLSEYEKAGWGIV
jgi:hypothetical protein